MITVNITTNEKGIRENPLKCPNCNTELIDKHCSFHIYKYCEKCKDFVGYAIKEMEK